MKHSLATQIVASHNYPVFAEKLQARSEVQAKLQTHWSFLGILKNRYFRWPL